MLTKDSRAKILDFELAQSTRKNDGTTRTAPGAAMGTAAYMSPEQVRDEQVDSRSGIFSFGALLYELLTNKKAFDANTPIPDRLLGRMLNWIGTPVSGTATCFCASVPGTVKINTAKPIKARIYMRDLP